MQTTEAWLTSGKYLPKFLRDFHDQKDVFKAIHEMYAVQEKSLTKDVSWVAAHIYVIDFFLWFMARRGYTLQRTHRKGEYRDIQKDVKEHAKKRHAAFEAMVLEGLTRKGETLREVE